MLTQVTDRSLISSAYFLTLVSVALLIQGEIYLGIGALTLPAGCIIEWANRRDQRATQRAIALAFARLNTIENDKLWLGIEAEIILSTATGTFHWELLCRTYRGNWFIAHVHMTGVEFVESIKVQEIAPGDAAVRLRRHSALYARFFGCPTTA